MAQFEFICDVDLQARTSPQPMHRIVGEGDVNGLRIGARVTSGGEAAELAGNCVGKVVRADGATVTLTGTIAGNLAYVVLDQESCCVEGPIQVAVCWVSGSNVTTLLIAYGTVVPTRTGNSIQPSTPIPDLDQLLAEIDNMRAATAAANAAAANAIGNFAGSFSDQAAYTAGQYVTYSDGWFYRFIFDHAAGAWDITDVEKVTTGIELEALNSALADFTQVVVGTNIFPGYVESGRLDNATGENYASDAFVRSGFIPVDASKGTLYVLRQTSPWALRLFFYDSSKTFLSPNVQVFSSTAAVLSGHASIPSGAAYVRTYRGAAETGWVQLSYTEESAYSPYATATVLKPGSIGEAELSEGVLDILDSAESAADEFDAFSDDLLAKTVINFFDGSFPNVGYFDLEGADASSSLYHRTDYIPVDPSNPALYILRTAQPYQLSVCFYDSEKSNIGNRVHVFRVDATDLIKSLPIPSTAAYFRMYVKDSDFSGNIMLSYIQQDAYVPYGERYIFKGNIISRYNLDDSLKNTLDSIFKLTGKTIAFLGDSIIGNFYDEDGVCARLAKATGATVINCAFGGSRIAYRYGSNIQYTYWNALSGAGLADAIASGDWTAQDTAIENMTGGLAYFADRLAEIKAIDWTAVDFVMWEYGTNDFMTKVALTGSDLYAYDYAYRHCIETILGAYPNIRIIPVTPIYRWYQQDGAFVDDSNTHTEEDYAGVSNKLTDFVAKAQEISRAYQLPCIDDYYTLGANRYTRLAYFDSTDGAHPNANGRSRIAEHIGAQLASLV